MNCRLQQPPKRRELKRSGDRTQMTAGARGKEHFALSPRPHASMPMRVRLTHTTLSRMSARMDACTVRGHDGVTAGLEPCPVLTLPQDFRDHRVSTRESSLSNGPGQRRAVLAVRTEGSELASGARDTLTRSVPRSRRLRTRARGKPLNERGRTATARYASSLRPETVVSHARGSCGTHPGAELRKGHQVLLQETASETH